MPRAPRHPVLSRERVVIAGTALVWIVLAVRLVHVQVRQRDHYLERAARQQTVTETIPARPGDIVDRAGRLLATSIRTHSLYVDPSRISDASAAAAQLATALDIDAELLRERLQRHRNRRFLWIKRRLTPGEVDAVRALDLPREAWGFRQEFQRVYPQGVLAAHVIGLRDIDGHGRGGAEEAFDSILRGTDGRRRLVRDARGYVIEVLEEVTEPNRDGRTITLTIDSVVQLAAERRLAALMERWRPQSACAVVLDPMSGEVLAMASRPTFDPNRPAEAAEASWRNHALAAVYEPGSTVKPCLLAWALEHGVIDRDDEFDCEMGAYRMGGRVLHDHHPYGVLSVTDILVKSSNIGMAKIGERMGNQRLHAATVAFGFGRRTGIELPGELPGLVRPLDEWTAYSTGSIPMGQEMAATPLQVVTAQAVLANGGRLLTPHVLLDASGEDPHAAHVVASSVLSEDVAEWVIREPLVQVVERGTGRQAQLEGITVFGKSGTAQKHDPVSGGYSARRHVSSFVCGAPAENPALLVLVSVDEPDTGGSQFGGTVAAPAAADILAESLRQLGIAPRRSGTEHEETVRRKLSGETGALPVSEGPPSSGVRR